MPCTNSRLHDIRHCGRHTVKCGCSAAIHLKRSLPSAIKNRLYSPSTSSLLVRDQIPKQPCSHGFLFISWYPHHHQPPDTIHRCVETTKAISMRLLLLPATAMVYFLLLLAMKAVVVQGCHSGETTICVLRVSNISTRVCECVPDSSHML